MPPMKLLCLHAERFSYTFDHPTPGADDHEAGQFAEYDEALVVFVAVEHDDEGKINHAAKEVRKLAHRAEVKRIVVNPFVHLTSEPATPDEARDHSHRLADRLGETFDGEVSYTSFGWYKVFRIDVRGDEASMFYRHV
jgi:threonyl-tRNA synthetase